MQKNLVLNWFNSMWVNVGDPLHICGLRGDCELEDDCRPTAKCKVWLQTFNIIQRLVKHKAEYKGYLYIIYLIYIGEYIIFSSQKLVEAAAR